MNTTALTDFFCPFFLHFCFWGFCCVRFLGGLYFERNEKTKNKIQNKTTKTKKKKKDHKMQTRRPPSLVTKTTQKLLTNIAQQNTSSCFHRLKAKQETRQKQKHKTKQNNKNKANIETERLKHTP